MELMLSGGAGAAAAVKDTTTKSFMADVIEASRECPIVVDFWAPWCGPCKTLGPKLEKAVRETKGVVRMVKMDIERHPEIATQLRVQSIPAVYAFKDGRPVDGFVGAVTDSQIKAFIKRLVDLAKDRKLSPVEAALEEAAGSLEAGDFGTGLSLFTHILQQEPDNLTARTGLGHCYLGTNRVKEARAALDGLLASLPPDQQTAPQLVTLRASVELAEQAAKAGSVGDLGARLAADPNDHQARFDLAMAHFGQGERAQAIEGLLDLVQRKRDWDEGAARKQLVKFFEAAPTDPLTLASRRRLSTILFS